MVFISRNTLWLIRIPPSSNKRCDNLSRWSMGRRGMPPMRTMPPSCAACRKSLPRNNRPILDLSRRKTRMPDYDPTAEALIAAIREALAPPEADAPRTYIDDLRAVQLALVEDLAEETPEAPDAETEQLMRQALGRVDPKNEDQYLGYGEVLRRL